MQRELQLRASYLQTSQIQSVYFGGGTPSIISNEHLAAILEQIATLFSIQPNAEITIEVNPDDTSLDRLKELLAIGFNRLSIGIQSFFPEDLQFMHRAHTAKQALACLENVHTAGFSNFSADLIYAFPLLTNTKFLNNLERMHSFDVKHLSCYQLTVEPGTALHHQVQKGKVPSPGSAQGAEQFMLLTEWATLHGYHHYEVSNLAQAGYEAVHNSSYWAGAHYLGIGPSAHSYDGTSRQWNLSNNALYVKAIEQQHLYFEKEMLGAAERFNETVMTQLRLSKGIERSWVEQHCTPQHFAEILQVIASHPEQFVQSDTHIILSDEGRLYADARASDFFIVS
jgi:oxygen-independent coproporphyrinogen-3 oxidase